MYTIPDLVYMDDLCLLDFTKFRNNMELNKDKEITKTTYVY